MLIAAQLIGGLVDDDPRRPRRRGPRHAAAEIELGLTAGPLLTDVRCRLDDRDDGPYENGTSEESTAASRAATPPASSRPGAPPEPTAGLIGDGTTDVEALRSGSVTAGRVTLCIALALGLVACSDDPDDEHAHAPSETSSSSTTTTAPERPASTTTTAFDPASVEGEVEAAYLKSWDVYADAVYDLVLDEEALAEVYAEDHLETKRTRSSGGSTRAEPRSCGSTMTTRSTSSTSRRPSWSTSTGTTRC